MTDTTDSLLAEHIHLELRERILAGQLAPGAALSVPKLARELGVSRSPVRDAVQQLVAEGVATHTPYAGARVRLVDDHHLADAFAVRRELDGLAAELAAERISHQDVEALHDSLAQQRRRLELPADAGQDRVLDTAFHAIVRRAAGNRALLDTLERLEAVSHLYRSAMWNNDANRRYAYDEHHRIAVALERGDPVDARTAARSHVDGVLRRMLRRPA